MKPADLDIDFGKVAVVMGGQSAEREVSLNSGACVLAGLLEAGVDAHAVDADEHLVEKLKTESFDRAFLILHGRGGEDGTVQGALEYAGIPYTGSGVLASALAMDKLRTKQLCKVMSIPTPNWRRVMSAEECELAAESMGLPLIIKPVFEGSSLGISKVEGSQGIAPAYKEAARYGTVMAEQFVNGFEVTAGILQGEALPLVKMTPKRDFYDYEAKYGDSGTEYSCPSGLDPELERNIQSLALAAFAAVGGRGWGRIDFIVDALGEAWLIEINTSPGMTAKSLVPQAAAAVGLSFPELVVRILATSTGSGR
ncbi:MAG: D-alanine--D-alanine ligase [Granulosicoccaceae bacterium]